MRACAVLLLALPLLAQNKTALLRLPDGKPDLGGEGVWFPRAMPDMVKGVKVPFQPQARTKFQENAANRQNDSTTRCLPPGVPRITYTPYPFQIVQMSNRIVFIYEGGSHVFRNVWMDGRAHPKDPNPNWMGDSIGRWEGDTLVIDSVGFNDKTWLDDAGHPHTEQLHVIEKYTRANASAMKYEVTIDDPGAYLHPWTSNTTIPFRPGGQLMEYLCLDGERPPVHAQR